MTRPLMRVLAREITRGDRVWLHGAWRTAATSATDAEVPGWVLVRVARLGVVELEATGVIACTLDSAPR